MKILKPSSNRSAAKRLFDGVCTDRENLPRDVPRKAREDGYRPCRQRHIARITIFRVVKSHKPVLQFDVLPTKCQQLATPHSRLNGQDDQGTHPRIAWTSKPPFLVTRRHIKSCKQALLLTEGKPASAAAVLRRATNHGNRIVDVHAPLLACYVDDVRNEVQVPVSRRARHLFEALIPPLRHELPRQGSNLCLGDRIPKKGSNPIPFRIPAFLLTGHLDRVAL